MERKPERDIDLWFFQYKSYYDDNDDYIVQWEFDWRYFMIAGIIVASVLYTIQEIKDGKECY